MNTYDKYLKTNESIRDIIGKFKQNKEQKKMIKHIVTYVDKWFPEGGKWRMGEVVRNGNDIKVFNVFGQLAIHYVGTGKKIDVKEIGPGMWDDYGDIKAELR